jgi:hypothetical protein
MLFENFSILSVLAIFDRYCSLISEELADIVLSLDDIVSFRAVNSRFVVVLG